MMVGFTNEQSNPMVFVAKKLGRKEASTVLVDFAIAKKAIDKLRIDAKVDAMFPQAQHKIDAMDTLVPFDIHMHIASGENSVVVDMCTPDAGGNEKNGLQSVSEAISSLTDLLFKDEDFKNSLAGNGGAPTVLTNDDFVGRVVFNPNEVPSRMPLGSPLVAQ
ncbi:hypothetical protein SUGI_0297400 [Cryptomeria japonica]|nr:hypothetical protein SUGI_0297400 [Cryptomeria japonica]